MTKHYRQVRLSTIVENKEGKVIKIGGYQADRRKSKVEVFSSNRTLTKKILNIAMKKI